MNNSYKDISEELQELLPKVFENEEFEHLIAFSRGEFSGLLEPTFINKEDTEKIKDVIFTKKAYPMLSKYVLKDREAKQAIFAKPCDTRALAYYLSENIIDREQLIIIGINGCPGLEDNAACDECDIKNAVIADYTVGKKIEDKEDNEDKEDKKDYPLANMTAEERKEYFSREFSRCTQCYACRDACPVCYCDHCFVESNQPVWVENDSSTANDMVFHLMRTMHMPGRCVNCGACEMACPEGIGMRSMASYLYHQAEKYFDYKPGLSPEQDILFSTYDKEDPEPGFLLQGGEE